MSRSNIQSATISIHTTTSPEEPSLSKLLPAIVADGEHFGVLRIQTQKIQITKTPIFILFTIDRTGSMGQSTGFDSLTCMDHVKHTFCNMITEFSKLDSTIYVCVQAFNTAVVTTVDTVRIIPDNVNEIVQKIKDLEPDGFTAIDSALISANEIMQSYIQENPDHEVRHVFMTDGEANSGERDDKKLADLVNRSFTNIFVGLGRRHNARLMNHFCDGPNAEFLFIDNPEFTGLIYGEVVYKFLYPAVKDCVIELQHGTIYNWQTGEWTSTIVEPVIVGDVEKIYHIKTATPDLLVANIRGKSTDTLDLLLSTIDKTTITFGEENKYMFRHEVQCILREAKLGSMSTYKSVACFNELKQKIRNLYRNMRRYLREFSSPGDSEAAMIRTLCSDLRTTFNTVGFTHCLMYTMARESSNGHQQAYTQTCPDDAEYILRAPVRRQNAIGRSRPVPADWDVLLPPMTEPPKLVRCNATINAECILPVCPEDTEGIAVSVFGSLFPVPPPHSEFSNLTLSDPEDAAWQSGFLPEDDLLQPDMYDSDDGNITCYATPSVMDTMRAISGNQNYGKQ